MQLSFLRKRWFLSLVAVPIVLSAVAFSAPARVAAPLNIPDSQPTISLNSVVTVQPATTEPPTAEPPTAEPPTAEPPTAEPPTAEPFTPTPSVEPTPTSRAPGTPLRVGIQVGHWKSNELPDELARLRTSSGAFAAGYAEADVNLDIAKRVTRLLESAGIVVDLLPATVPPAYDADAFVAIHADGSSNGTARGFKATTPWRTSRASQQLLDALIAEYAAATGLPQDGAITFNMRGYYAFSYRRHTHAIAKTTPAVILEMGFLTSAADRAMMLKQGDNIAVGIANGIIRYLNTRDPGDGAALLPPDFRNQRALDPAGVDVFAAPRDDAPVLLRAEADRRLMPIQERDGWYQVVVSGGSRTIGWVRKDSVTEMSGPTPTPPPATDS